MTNEQAYRYLKRVYLSTKNDSYREALSVAMSYICPTKSENSIESLLSRAEEAEKIVDEYAEAARAIALWLSGFCNKELSYPSMISDAARKISIAYADIKEILGDEYDLSRLRELVQADREGRCVVLPCKPGNTVWSANVFGVSSHVIRRIELNQDGDFACSMLVFPFEDFGNKVFLTREAAEAALKEREKNEP